jgi:predicted membrane channel-forming protein YqfA (hemolysin III family)
MCVVATHVLTLHHMQHATHPQFHSHTNWHICCVLGSVQTFITAYHCYTNRHLYTTCLL